MRGTARWVRRSESGIRPLKPMKCGGIRNSANPPLFYIEFNTITNFHYFKQTTMSHHSKAVLITCMDVRHDGKLTDAIREAAGVEHRFYTITRAGGAGVLSNAFTERAPGVIFETKAAVEKLGAEEVYLAVHGVSEGDMKGCGGYVLCGHGHHYESPETSRDFSYEELRLAAKRLREEGIEKPIRTFYITFSEAGDNLVEEVLIEEVAA